MGKLSKRYASEGLACLYDKPRPGRPIKITAKQRDQITVLACESSPEGSSQWSLRLLADKVVELGYCESISHSQVGEILKKENKTSPYKNLVYRNNYCGFSSMYGKYASPLRSAIR